LNKEFQITAGWQTKINEEEHLKKLEKEMKQIYDKKVESKLKMMRSEKREEELRIRKQIQDINLEKSSLDFRMGNFLAEKYEFEHEQSLHYGTNSLGRRRKYNFSFGPLKFGRQ